MKSKDREKILLCYYSASETVIDVVWNEIACVEEIALLCLWLCILLLVRVIVFFFLRGEKDNQKYIFIRKATQKDWIYKIVCQKGFILTFYAMLY